MADIPSSATGTQAGGVKYATRDKTYFEKRGLQRYAGIWSLWALGVGAVISGHFSGWNFGFATGGWGGMLVAGIIIAIMYLGLTFSIAEMSPALPHTGAAYSFARSSMGPWGGFVTGLFENVEYVLTPAVICTFISAYFGSITGLDTSLYPVLWIVFYAIFLALNIFGVALSYKVTLAVTLISLAGLAFFYISAFGHIDFSRWALNIAPDGSELPEGGGEWFPKGLGGVLATLPFAVWLFLAIEQVPLAAEESVDPKRDMPRGIMLGFATLALSAFLVVLGLVAGAGARRYPRHVPGCGLGGFGLRRRGADRPRRFVPHHSLRPGAAGLFAEPRRLFSIGAVGNACQVQDPAFRHDRRFGARAGRDAGDLVRQWGRRAGRNTAG
jgi:ethanolamine permease